MPTPADLLAHQARLATMRRDSPRAKQLYLDAARHEEYAMFSIEKEPKIDARSYGIVAISAVTLYRKAADEKAAMRLAKHALKHEWLPDTVRSALVSFTSPKE